MAIADALIGERLHEFGDGAQPNCGGGDMHSRGRAFAIFRETLRPNLFA